MRRFLILAALLWLLYCCAAAWAQSRADVQRDLSRLESQFGRTDQELREFRVQLERRLATVEAQIEIQSRVLWGVAGAIGFLILETGWSLVLRRRKGE